MLRLGPAELSLRSSATPASSLLARVEALPVHETPECLLVWRRGGIASAQSFRGVACDFA
jgi:hypothetical protein